MIIDVQSWCLEDWVIIGLSDETTDLKAWRPLGTSVKVTTYQLQTLQTGAVLIKLLQQI